MAETTMSQVVALLAPTLGKEKARETVQQAIRRLSIDDNSSNQEDAKRIVQELLSFGGAIASAAKFADSRLPEVNVVNQVAMNLVKETSNSNQIPLDTLVGLFARALGDAKAKELITTTATAARVRFPCTNLEAQKLLDLIATQPGLIGITARFAKARILLI